MNVIKCEVGIWRAEARLKEISGARRMATISATAGKGRSTIHSMHTVVFDHAQGTDEEEEVRALMRNVLLSGH